MGIQDLVNEIGQKAKDSGMDANIFYRALFRNSSGELLSQCILQEIEIPTWNGWKGPDFFYIGQTEFSKLLPEAKDKIIDLIAGRNDYQRLVTVAGENVKTRPDILIQASEYSENSNGLRDGMFSLYLAHISGNKKRLRKSVKKQLESAMNGSYRGGYFSSQTDCQDNPLPKIVTDGGRRLFNDYRMEDLADFLEETGFEKQARKVRERMIGILDCSSWSLHDSFKEPKRTMNDILTGKGNPELDDYMVIMREGELGLYLRTAGKLGYAEVLHPRAIDSVINYLNRTPIPIAHFHHDVHVDQVLAGLETIKREEATFTPEQESHIKEIILKKYFADLDNKYDEQKRRARNSYESVWQMFKDDSETADKIVLSILKHTSDDDKPDLLERLQTHDVKMEAVEHCLYRNVYGKDGFKPQKALTYLSSSDFSQLDPREQQAINRLIGQYERNHMEAEATCLMESLGMRDKLDMYAQVKGMLENFSTTAS